MIDSLIHTLVCNRCGCVFMVVDEPDEGALKTRVAILETNTCSCCGKGQVTYLGKVVVAR